MLALLTFFLVVVGFFQARWVKRTIFGSRAHVSFARFGIENFNLLLGNAGEPKQPIVSFEFINVGETVAFPGEYAAALEWFDGRAPRKPSYKNVRACTTGTILNPRGEGGFQERCALNRDMVTAEMVDALTEGRAELLFYGVIRYRDVYSYRRETRFCLKWDPDKRRFDYGPRTYQRYK